MPNVPPPTALPNIPIISATEVTANKEERQQQLPIDKVVRATVVEGGQDKVMLELGHRRFVAETRVPLQTGQKLNMLVVATSPKLELQIISDQLQARLSQSFHLLNGQLEIFPLVQQLLAEGKSIFDQLNQSTKDTLQIWASLQRDLLGARTGEELKLLAKRLGLDLEARLALGDREMTDSLKSALLELMNKLDGKGGDLAERVGRLLHQLELFQLCQLKLAQQDINILPLPLPFLEEGYMLTERGKEQAKDEDGKAPIKISLNLALKKLGDLRIDFLHDSQGLFLRFACDSQEKADYIAGYQKELRETLTAVPLQGVSYTADAENPAKALITALISENDSVLDTRV